MTLWKVLESSGYDESVTSSGTDAPVVETIFLKEQPWLADTEQNKYVERNTQGQSRDTKFDQVCREYS